MNEVKVGQPKEFIEIDNIDFIGHEEVILWCCAKCGHSHISILNNR
jgi:hypothetical protein